MELLDLVLFAAAFLAGFIDTIAGGGGLIALPALLMSGLEPALAIGTLKFQSMFGTFSSSLTFVRAGYIDLGSRVVIFGGMATGAGAIIGASAVNVLDRSVLERLIPFLLVFAALCIVVLRPGKVEAGKQRMHPYAYFAIFGLLLGFYDGFFGPGTGIFWALSMILLVGFSLKTATAHTKLMNLVSNVVAVAAFAVAARIHYKYGLVMAVGQFLGGMAGAKMAIAKGGLVIRPLLFVMALLICARMVW